MLCFFALVFVPVTHHQVVVVVHVTALQAAGVQPAFQATGMEGEVKKGNLICMLSRGQFWSDTKRKGVCVCSPACTV